MLHKIRNITKILPSNGLKTDHLEEGARFCQKGWAKATGNRWIFKGFTLSLILGFP